MAVIGSGIRSPGDFEEGRHEIHEFDRTIDNLLLRHIAAFRKLEEKGHTGRRFERVALPELEEGSYYWCDIIGLAVFTTDEQYIGRVESIISTGSNDVFMVKDLDKGDDNETLIPALESVVLEIDFEHKTMRVALPEGL